MKRDSLFIYDLVGATVTLALIGAGVWCGVVRPHGTSRRIATLESNLAEIQATQRANEDVVRRKTSELTTLTQDLNRRGALPDQSPVEADLRTLTQVAQVNGFEIVEVAPLTSHVYPGVSELRYRIKGRSSYAGLIAFLIDFEQTGFWADIVDLKVDRAPAAKDDQTRSVELVVSLFASRSVTEPDSEL
jgi:hypothetical protein